MNQSRRGFIGRVGAIFAAPFVAPPVVNAGAKIIATNSRGIPIGRTLAIPNELGKWMGRQKTKQMVEMFSKQGDELYKPFLDTLNAEDVMGQTPRLSRDE